MTTKTKLMMAGVLAVCFASSMAQAQTQGQNFDVYFTGNGSAVIDLFTAPGGPTTSSYTESGFLAVDPTTGQNALTFALPTQVGTGIVDIYTASSVLNGAIDFYNGSTGYMAEYANSGGQLDETINSGYVPTGGYPLDEDAAGDFIWESGGSLRANNDYFGTITSSQLLPSLTDAPDGGSTLGLLGGAFTLLCAASRKLRK